MREFPPEFDESGRYIPSQNVVMTCNGQYLDVRIIDSEKLFINIEEDMMGQDVMTFKCPECVETHKSLVLG